MVAFSGLRERAALIALDGSPKAQAWCVSGSPSPRARERHLQAAGPPGGGSPCPAATKSLRLNPGSWFLVPGVWRRVRYGIPHLLRDSLSFSVKDGTHAKESGWGWHEAGTVRGQQGLAVQSAPQAWQQEAALDLGQLRGLPGSGYVGSPGR